MSNQSIENRVKQVLVDELALDVAPQELVLEDSLYAPHIRLDSLGYLRLVMGIEREFEIPLAVEEIGSTVFETVGDIVSYVTAKSP